MPTLADLYRMPIFADLGPTSRKRTHKVEFAVLGAHPEHAAIIAHTIAGWNIIEQSTFSLLTTLLRTKPNHAFADQAHFTKEFRKMTGHSPQKFIREVSNEFGRRLVRQQQV